MRRKRRSDTGAVEMTEVLVSCGFPRVRGIWFTVAFRETITIAAIGTPRRCVTPPLARTKDGSRPCEAAQEFRTLSGTRKMACRAMRRRWSDQQCGELGVPRVIGGTKNEGVGEHVRTRFHLKLKTNRGFGTAGEIADHEIRTERRKPVSSAGPVFERANSLERTIQPFDLMSRRHPLSSTRAPVEIRS